MKASVKIRWMLSLFFVFLPVSSVLAANNQSVLGCILEPSQKIEISSPVVGVIENIPLQRGQRVSEGELLFSLRSGVEAATVELAKAKADFAARTNTRNAELYDDDLLSSYERDEIETETLLAAIELKTAQEELDMRSVSSPVSGVVIDKFSDIGEYVSTDPVLEIAVLDPLYAEVLMPFERFREFEVGDILEVGLASPIAGNYEAVISIIDPIIDPASGTFRIRLQIPNNDFSIPAGVICSLANKNDAED